MHSEEDPPETQVHTLYMPSVRPMTAVLGGGKLASLLVSASIRSGVNLYT